MPPGLRTEPGEQMSDFFSMGGYAFYIWGSYLAALILVGGEIALLVKQKNALKRHGLENAGKRDLGNDSHGL